VKLNNKKRVKQVIRKKKKWLRSKK